MELGPIHKYLQHTSWIVSNSRLLGKMFQDLSAELQERKCLSLGMKTTDQKEAAFCMRYTHWEYASSVIMPVKFPFPLQSYPQQLNTILRKM